MLKEFEHIPGLADVCEMLGVDSNNVNELSLLIGVRTVKRDSILDMLVSSGMIESKTRFRKNPQTIHIDGVKVMGDSIVNKNGFVLSIGKGASFQCKYIKYEKEV